jgi:hypothetical protein
VTLVLLILAVIWAAVLIPPALRARAEGRPADSITAFRRQLAVLRRTGPRSLRQPGADPTERHLVAARPLRAVPHGPRAAGLSRPPVSGRRGSSVSSTTRRRRRDVLLALLSIAGGTLVFGAVPALRWLWVAHLFADALLVAYVALLIRQRNLAAERELKVRFLPGPRPVDDDRWVENRAWLDSESAWLAN